MEDLIKSIIESKKLAVINQRYDIAANLRDIERDLIKHLKIKQTEDLINKITDETDRIS